MPSIGRPARSARGKRSSSGRISQVLSGTEPAHDQEHRRGDQQARARPQVARAEQADAGDDEDQQQHPRLHHPPEDLRDVEQTSAPPLGCSSSQPSVTVPKPAARHCADNCSAHVGQSMAWLLVNTHARLGPLDQRNARHHRLRRHPDRRRHLDRGLPRARLAIRLSGQLPRVPRQPRPRHPGRSGAADRRRHPQVGRRRPDPAGHRRARRHRPHPHLPVDLARRRDQRPLAVGDDAAAAAGRRRTGARPA